MSLGSEIKRIRKLRKMTQEDLAVMLGVKTITVRKYESDEREPKNEILTNIANALGVSVLSLIATSMVERYELENALLKDEGNVSELVTDLENANKEGSTRMFRQLINIFNWTDLRKEQDDTIYDVLRSEDLYNYLKYVFHKAKE